MLRSVTQWADTAAARGRSALQIADSRDRGAAASCVHAESKEHVAAPRPCPGGGTWGDTATDPAGSEGGCLQKASCYRKEGFVMNAPVGPNF